MLRHVDPYFKRIGTQSTRTELKNNNENILTQQKLCNISEVNAWLAIGKNSHEISQCVKSKGGKRRNTASLGPVSRHSIHGYSKMREGWRRCDFYQRVSGFHYDFLKPNFMNEM